MRRAALALGLTLVSAALGPAAAQRGAAPGDFDFYVLALSWSPGFCSGTGESRGLSQCDSGRRLGFVVHGLWPQNERGYPSACGGQREAPRYAIEQGGGIYPDPGLARHEWRTHGTCSGLSPTAYFAAVKRAREVITIPDPLVALGAEGRTTPLNLERAFVAVNPGLRTDTMAITCRNGALQEVRICMDKTLTGFRPCPEINRASCRAGQIRIDAPR